jgi:hypothetical protein
VPLEGAGRLAEAPAVEGQADQRCEGEDGVQEPGGIEGSADKPEAWDVHAGVRVHKSSLVRLAFGRQFMSVDRNKRVQAQYPTPLQQARAPDTDAGSDMHVGEMW